MPTKKATGGRRTKADYAKHYAEYQGKPDQIKNRAQRNKARATMVKAGKAKKGDGKDVGHKRPISKGGGNSPQNLSMQSKAKNRGHGMRGRQKK